MPPPTSSRDAPKEMYEKLIQAPVERIANACDVAGLLEERTARAAEREQIKRAWRVLSRDTPRRYRSRRSGRLFGCLRFLGELT